MPETEQKIEQFELDYICDKCGVGKMRRTGITLTSDPPQFPHICDNKECGEKKTFTDIYYPATAYRRIGEPRPSTR